MKPKSFNIEHLRCGSFQRAGKTFDMVLYATFMQEAASGMNRPHRHNYYMIFLPTRGKGQQLIDFKGFDIVPGRAFLMYPGQIHAWQTDHKLDGYLLFFTSEFFNLRYHNNNLLDFPFFQPGTAKPYVDLCDQELHELSHIADNMLQEYKLGEPDFLKVLRSYLNILLVRLSRHYEVEQRTANARDKHANLIIQNFKQLIEKHYIDKHRVKDYAELLLITPNYLNAISTKITGVSAGTLIRNRIMLEAKRMLLHDNRTVAEIGHDLQFEDSSYFCRFFKKYEGTSPEKFRKQFQNSSSQ